MDSRVVKGFFTLMLCSTNLFAEGKQNLSNVLSDPAYLPESGAIISDTSYSFMKTKSVWHYPGGSDISLNSRSQVIGQEFSYGFLGNIVLTLGGLYVIKQKDEREYGAGYSPSKFSYRSDGFENPFAGITYRVFSQRDFPFTLDVKGSYSPDVFDSELADPDRDGTVASGGQQSKLSTALSFQRERFTVQAVVGADYLSEQKSTYRVYLNSDERAKYVVGSSWGYFGGLHSQIKFGSRFSMNFGVGYAARENENIRDISNILPIRRKSGSIRDVSLAANYHVIPNRVVVQFNYLYQKIGNTSYGVDSAPWLFFPEVKDQEGRIFTSRLLYSF